MQTSLHIAKTSDDAALGRKHRIGWVDAMRGLGIVLVVAGHALNGFFSAFGEMPGALFAHGLIYTFHMPLFMLAAGQFAGGVLAQPFEIFVQRMGSRIVYPFVLWSILHILTTVLLSGYTNHSATLSELATFWFDPVSVYWFFQALLIGFLGAYALRRAPDQVVIGLGLAMLAGGASFAWFTANEYIYRLVFMPGFFLLGARFSADRLFEVAQSPAIVALAGAGASVTALLIAIGVHYKTPLLAICAPFAFILLCAAFAIALTRVRIAQPLAALGAASIAIFTAHIFFTAGARIALQRLFGAEAFAIVFPITLLAGVLGPFLIYRAARAMGVLPLIGWR